MWHEEFGEFSPNHPEVWKFIVYGLSMGFFSFLFLFGQSMQGLSCKEEYTEQWFE